MKRIKIITRFGIADAHGLESYTDDASARTLLALQLRAECNRQRHAVMYRAAINQIADDRIVGLLANQDYDGALKELKRSAQISFPTRFSSLYKKSWSMIPNPSLDPWKG